MVRRGKASRKPQRRWVTWRVHALPTDRSIRQSRNWPGPSTSCAPQPNARGPTTRRRNEKAEALARLITVAAYGSPRKTAEHGSQIVAENRASCRWPDGQVENHLQSRHSPTPREANNKRAGRRRKDATCMTNTYLLEERGGDKPPHRCRHGDPRSDHRRRGQADRVLCALSRIARSSGPVGISTG